MTASTVQGRDTLPSDERVAVGIALIGLVPDPLDLVPLLGVDRRQVGVAGEVALDLGDHEAVGALEEESIDLRPADDEHLILFPHEREHRLDRPDRLDLGRQLLGRT